MIANRLETIARDRRAWFALLALALVPRLAFVLTAPDRLLYDGRLYEGVARGLLEHGRYDPLPIYPPGYPFFIAGVYAVLGKSLLALRVVESLLGAGTVALVGWFGARLFGPLAGLIAAALAAFHPVMAFLPMTQYPENLLLFLTALGFGLVAFGLTTPSARGWFAAGLVFGVAVLVKPVTTSLLPGLALGSWFQLGRLRYPRWRAALLFAIGLALPVAPWVIRSHAVHERWFMVSTGGGRIFWVVNNRETDGVSMMVDTPDLSDTLWATPNYVDRDRYYYRVGQRFVREQPARALRGYVRRIGRLWALHPTPTTQNQYSVRAADWAQSAASLVMYAGAALGLSRIAGAGLVALPLAALSFTLVNAWYFMTMRYRMTFEVVLLWMAGAGFAAWLTARARGATPAGGALPSARSPADRGPG